MSEAVLVVSFGGPEKPEDVMPFLENVTRGRGIPRERLLGVAEHYQSMGGRSPINEITRRQAEGLRAALAKRGDARPVYVGQRNWHPFLEDVLRRMRDDGIVAATALCTSAYGSESSLERYVAAVAAAREKVGPDAPTVRFVAPWFDHPGFIAAIAARVREAQPDPSAAWVFTAHSIPCAMAKDSVYVEELRTAAGLVARELGREDWTLAFTSRSGNPRDPWLEPDFAGLMPKLAAAGVKGVFAIPSGFVADHVEVLFDLDVDAKAAAGKAGLAFGRAATVGDHPLFLEMMADVVLAGPPAVASLAESSAATLLRDGLPLERVGKDSASCLCFPGAEAPPCRRPR